MIGTYFPPSERNGLIAFPTLITRINNVWQKDRANVVKLGDSVHASLVDRTNLARRDSKSSGLKDPQDASTSVNPAASGSDEKSISAMIDEAFAHFASQHDADNGGFGRESFPFLMP